MKTKQVLRQAIIMSLVSTLTIPIVMASNLSDGTSTTSSGISTISYGDSATSIGKNSVSIGTKSHCRHNI